MRWLLVLSWSTGCAVNGGGGPVLAVRMNGDVAVGVECNASPIPVFSVEGGATFLVHAHRTESAVAPALAPALGAASGYMALTGSLLWNRAGSFEPFGQFTAGVHGQLGIAWGQAGLGVLAAVGPEIASAVHGTVAGRQYQTDPFDDNFTGTPACDPHLMLNVRLGLRWFGRVPEIYLAPTVGYSTGELECY